MILLKKRTEPPVPKEILLAKDINGLTPLHKAAGLGHEEIVKTILSVCPEAIGRTDSDSRTALHYAAAAKGSGATYDTLLDYKADEAIQDKMNHKPPYYIQNPKEVDQRVLSVIPEAPRTASVFPPLWDWSFLQTYKGVKGRPPAPVPSTNGDSAFEDMVQDDTPDKLSPRIAKEMLLNKTMEESHRPQTYDIDGEADEGVDEGEEEKEKGYNGDNEEQDGHYEAEYAEVDTEFDLNNEPTLVKTEQVDQKESLDILEEEKGRQTAGGITTQDKRIDADDHPYSTGREVSVDEERIKHIVEAGNIEEMAALVLAGDGASLSKQRSKDPDIQMFINNIPTYLNKIQRVHSATREGNLKELQSALDRRKFAVAHESMSPLRVTPLHLAVLYGRTSVLRFLAGRFPETMQAIDTKGRTPLHYAAALNDNGHFYNILTNQGADKKIQDIDGKTPEYYLEHPDHLTREQLLTEFEGQEMTDLNKPPSTADKGLSEKAVVTSSLPVFGPDEGRYLASSLGQPLIKGLSEVVSKRPQNPVKYLANYLYSYEADPQKMPQKALGETYTKRQFTPSPEPVPALKPIPEHPLERTEIDEKTIKEDEKEEENTPDLDRVPSAFKPVQRDEYGQMVLHFAMARTHGRNALFQLLQEVDCNIAFRDELYRTPRDVAEQVNIVENVQTIDKYVVSLAATGQVDKLRELLAEGYDHIVDVQDDNVSIFDIAQQRGQSEVTTFLESINSFEDKREKLHRAIRLASDSQVQDILQLHPGLAVAKNTHCRCSLHIAVLNQHDSIVHYIAQKYPQTLLLGDNLMRTALHYAMGVERVETLGKVLIQSGATRVVKDLKGRQPSYYFMNKSEIQKLQDEEEMLRV